MEIEQNIFSQRRMKRMSLLEKLNNITTQMGALGKSGKNPKFSYSYVKGEDAMKIFRQLEVENKIKVIPETVTESVNVMAKAGDKGFVTTFVVKYHIMDLESEDRLTITIPVQGYDTTDKGVYKALTGGFKYFLLQTFSYSSDDPEEVAEAEAKTATATAAELDIAETVSQGPAKAAPASSKPRFGGFKTKGGNGSAKTVEADGAKTAPQARFRSSGLTAPTQKD
jgi:hypothetical protein